MARKIGPDANSRLVYAVTGTRLQPAVGATATVYSDAAGTILADIAAYQPGNPGTPGGAIAGSTVAVDGTSQLPLFWFPADGTDVLYAQVAGGPVTPINASFDGRLDALEGGAVVDATTTTKGVIKLAGDLNGTAAAPTVPGLATRLVYRSDWAVGQAYAVNDLVRLAGTVAVATLAHTSGATFDRTKWTPLGLEVGAYNVMWYGAQGDGVTDDTAAITACIADAVATETANGRYRAKVTGPQVTYRIAGALTQGGATKGNAQIPLPITAETGQGFDLALDFGGNAASPWYFGQTTIQTAGGGATFLSTQSGTNDGTFGEASVIGGPTPAQGYGRATPKFSNMCLTINGLRVVLPNNPSICGIDLAGLARANIVNAGVLVNATPGTVSAPTSGYQFALRMPDNNNNDYCEIDKFTAYGCNFGVIIGEHTNAKSIRCIFCVAGMEVGRGGDTAHGSYVAYYSAEACTVALGAVQAGFPAKVTIALLDFEGSGFAGGTFAVFNDPTNLLLGSAHYTNVGQTHLVYQPGGGNNGVRGCANFRIFDDTWQQGDIGASTPAVPASGTPVTNPVFNNVMVSVAGGTVSNIAINGVNQGLTSGPFHLGPGMTITLTYTGAPTWKWTIL